MKYQYRVNHFQKNCVRCNKNADHFYIHKNKILRTVFGVYGYCKKCLRNTNIIYGPKKYEYEEVIEKDIEAYKKINDVSKIMNQ